MKVRLFDLVMNVLPTLLFIDSELNIFAHEFVQLIFKLLFSLLIGSEGLEPLKLM